LKMKIHVQGEVEEFGRESSRKEYREVMSAVQNRMIGAGQDPR